MQDDSFAALAQKMNSSSYLSIGYYRYFRGGVLHIPEPLMVELNLYAYRLEEMNIGLQVIDDSYDYNLPSEVASRLLEDYTWQSWPKGGGGEFYLDSGVADSAHEYYFFKSGNQYFLLTPGLISEMGVMDVPVFN
jgi:hypothetical protein